MLRLHPAYQSNSRAVPISALSILKVIFDLPNDSRVTQMQSQRIRKCLSFWSLASEVRPQFQRLLKFSIAAEVVVQNSVAPVHREIAGLEGEKVPEDRKAIGDYES